MNTYITFINIEIYSFFHLKNKQDFLLKFDLTRIQPELVNTRLESARKPQTFKDNPTRNKKN